MLTDQFRKDYRQMTAQGVKFTPEDIVLLNALMVKVRLSQSAARDVHLPRLAFLPDIKSRIWWIFSRNIQGAILREPTIAHDLWLERAEEWIDVGDDRNFYFLHAYALAHPAEALPDADDPRTVIRSVYRFAAQRLACYTMEQLSAAVDYCLYGADWTVGEDAPKKVVVDSCSGRNEDDNSALQLQLQTTTDPSPTIGLLTDCRMVRLPISLDDAKRMTASELMEAILRARHDDGMIDRKKAKSNAFGEYVRARDEIRMRSSREDASEATDQARGPQTT